MTKCWPYFRSRRLLNFTDEARIVLARDALVPPKWRNMAYRIYPYCVNRRPRFTQKGGIMELRRHVMSCSRRPENEPIPALLAPQRIQPLPRLTPSNNHEEGQYEDQNDHALDQQQRLPKWSVYTFTPASPPCLRSMLGESYKVPTPADDPSKMASDGAHIESARHLLMECECAGIQRLKKRIINHLLKPGVDPPQVDADLLQKAVWSNDRQLYLFFENSLSVLPRRLLA